MLTTCLPVLKKTKHEPESISPDKELYNKEVHACYQVIASAVFKLIGSLVLKATYYHLIKKLN
jgi:hypothetical protein